MFAKVSSVLAVAVFASSVAAQTNATYVDPNSVDLSTRASWCNGEYDGCTALCGNDIPTMNSCDYNTLVINCTCTNGTAPDLAAYADTMPSYICQQSFQDCIAAHPNDLDGQNACKSNIQSQCGTLDYSTYTAPVTSSSATSTASSTSAPTSSATVASSTPTDTGAAVALKVGQEYGVGIIAAGAVAAFGLIL